MLTGFYYGYDWGNQVFDRRRNDWTGIEASDEAGGEERDGVGMAGMLAVEGSQDGDCGDKELVTVSR